jgi:hypothetical protein
VEKQSPKYWSTGNNTTLAKKNGADQKGQPHFLYGLMPARTTFSRMGDARFRPTSLLAFNIWPMFNINLF